MRQLFGKIRGFSLMELLVVLAIISVLAAVLLPVYSKVRGESRESVCVSHLRQLADAFTMYADDYDGVLPCPGGLVGERNYWDPGLESYTKSRRETPGDIWVCPQHVQRWRVPYEKRSYSMNMYLRTPPDIDPWQRNIYVSTGIAVTNIDDPVKTILLCEGKWDLGTGYVDRPANWETVAGYRITRTAPRHMGGNNYLFCDGHIKWMEIEDTLDPVNLWYVREEKRRGNR